MATGAGDCSLLQAQFTGVQDDDGNVAIPDDYVCHQFPDDNSQRDTILVGLISLAVCFPVRAAAPLRTALTLRKPDEPY